MSNQAIQEAVSKVTGQIKALSFSVESYLQMAMSDDPDQHMVGRFNAVRDQIEQLASNMKAATQLAILATTEQGSRPETRLLQ